MQALSARRAISTAAASATRVKRASADRPRATRRVRAVSTTTVTETETATATATGASTRVVLSQTKSGEMRVSWGPPPNPSARARAPDHAAPAAGPESPSEEQKLYGVIDCQGGMASTGLVLAHGPDDLLQVVRVHPGGTAEGVLAPRDVLTACSVLVMVEDDDGDFTPEFRWHDATASSAEHTLGVLMTHDGELRVRFCRGYVPRADKAIRAAWRALVPVTPARGVRETWSRLLWREGDGARAKPSVEEEVVEDGSPRGIWSGIFGPGKPRDVGGDARRCWAAVLPAQDRDQARVEAETETETEAEAEAEAEAETEAAVSPAEPEAVPETTSVDVEPALETACVVAEVDAPPPATDSDVPAVQKTWDEFEVTLDCTAGVNMTGLQFAQREDGLLRVSVCKPGGTASKKVKINDVLLATTYVVMVPDPSGERRAGIPQLEWMDAVNEGHSFNTLQEAMMTHAQEMKLKLARGDVPLGALSQPAAKSEPEPGSGSDAESPEAAAERRYNEAEREREARGVRTQGKKEMDVGADVPDDIKAWAEKIAAEARAKRSS